MTAALKQVKVNPKLNLRPTADDQKIIVALRKKLGVDTSQILRLGIRALATKENVTA
jgi:hypothetical protein